ncbi:unnamed protein product [Strongylus vulgaris]|uniref:Calcineurin-like phosphoesterase domain-containing protein n=1 Tax=Strongylus vulgaris TaxID=40348 RepID=A0A3P7IVP0_STRVU|nr:unnamed protein product [Strongylus vulgaris]
MCHGMDPAGTLGFYGDFMCDAPMSLVEYTLKEAQRIIPNPDLILWTGDSVPHSDNYPWKKGGCSKYTTRFGPRSAAALAGRGFYNRARHPPFQLFEFGATASSRIIIKH